MPETNFLIFNEANNVPVDTMGDADYLASQYRTGGVIKGIADPLIHNKMYRQWSVMGRAIAQFITSEGFDAMDYDPSDLADSLKSAVSCVVSENTGESIEKLAESVSGKIDRPSEWQPDFILVFDSLGGVVCTQSRVSDFAPAGHTHSVSDIADLSVTADEINKVISSGGVPADLVDRINAIEEKTEQTAESVSAFEDKIDGDIEGLNEKIDSIGETVKAPFMAGRLANKAYQIEDIASCPTLRSFQYLECVIAGTTNGDDIRATDTGQLIQDGTVTWLVCDIRDSAPVGTIKMDYVLRKGWLKCNGAEIDRQYYPRLVRFMEENPSVCINTITKDPADSSVGGKLTAVSETSIKLPNLVGRWIRGGSDSSTGNVIKPGLPNITGSWANVDMNRSFLDAQNHKGAFYRGAALSAQNTLHGLYSTEHYQPCATSFSASRSSGIYGSSDTVQPPSISLMPIIKY